MSYILLVAGVLCDHFSTALIRSLSGFYEANERVVYLTSMGLWLPLDLLFMILGVIIPYISIRASRTPSPRGLLAYPLLHGIIRLGGALWNLSLMFFSPWK